MLRRQTARRSVSRNFYRKVYKPAVRRALPADLHALRFHDLRHTGRQLGRPGRAHPLVISKVLGHRKVETTMSVYSHLFPAAGEALAAPLDAGYAAAEAVPLADVVDLRR